MLFCFQCFHNRVFEHSRTLSPLMERILDHDLQKLAKFAKSNLLTFEVAARSYDSMVHIMKMVKGDGEFLWTKKNEKKNPEFTNHITILLWTLFIIHLKMSTWETNDEHEHAYKRRYWFSFGLTFCEMNVHIWNTIKLHLP